MVSVGSNAERQVDDILLARYAYLTAQNGDARKPENQKRREENKCKEEILII